MTSSLPRPPSPYPAAAASTCGAAGATRQTRSFVQPPCPEQWRRCGRGGPPPISSASRPPAPPPPLQGPLASVSAAAPRPPPPRTRRRSLRTADAVVPPHPPPPPTATPSAPSASKKLMSSEGRVMSRTRTGGTGLTRPRRFRNSTLIL